MGLSSRKKTPGLEKDLGGCAAGAWVGFNSVEFGRENLLKLFLVSKVFAATQIGITAGLRLALGHLVQELCDFVESREGEFVEQQLAASELLLILQSPFTHLMLFLRRLHACFFGGY